MYRVKALNLQAQYPLFREMAIVLLSSFALALSSQLVIHLPFTPVPITTQSLTVLLLAALLGARRAGAAVFAFLVQGTLGLPVFAIGRGFFGPSGGYLLGFLIAAFVVGWLIERKKTFWHVTCALTLGTLLIYLFGASYLATFIGLKKALLLGVVPFLLGDALKICVCLKILQWLKRI